MKCLNWLVAVRLCLSHINALNNGCTVVQRETLGKPIYFYSNSEGCLCDLYQKQVGEHLDSYTDEVLMLYQGMSCSLVSIRL